MRAGAARYVLILCCLSSGQGSGLHELVLLSLVLWPPAMPTFPRPCNDTVPLIGFLVCCVDALVDDFTASMRGVLVFPVSGLYLETLSSFSEHLSSTRPSVTSSSGV